MFREKDQKRLSYLKRPLQLHVEHWNISVLCTICLLYTMYITKIYLMVAKTSKKKVNNNKMYETRRMPL